MTLKKASARRPGGRLNDSDFSDKHIGLLTGNDEATIRRLRKEAGILPSYKIVDTCAAEFESFTPYFYSTYDQENESDAQRPIAKSSSWAAVPTASARASNLTTAACTAFWR